MSNHTPGPWRVHRYPHIRGEQWLSVLYGAWDITHNKDAGEIATAKYSAMSDEENLANAHLISAAPDLLAACEEVQQSLLGLGIFDSVEGIENTMLGRINAAIAKAKGLVSE